MRVALLSFACVSFLPLQEGAEVNTCTLDSVLDCDADHDSGFSLLQMNMHLQDADTASDAASQSAQKSISAKSRSVKAVNSSPTEPQARQKTIAEIFQESGTDKMERHGYQRYYETELAPYRNIDGVRILEIGADTGASLGAWMSYFTCPAAVQGVAYRVDAKKAKDAACSLMPSACEKLSIFSMDQSDVHALASLVRNNSEGWDIIIDDGSHKPEHQLISFQRLWPNIRPGGLYVIEDIETSYVDNGESVYGYELHGGIGETPPVNAVEQFKRLVDVVNRKHFGHPDFTVFAGVDKDVARVSFADGLIFLQKKPASQDWDKYPTRLFANRENTARTYAAYKSKTAPVNAWFQNLK